MDENQFCILIHAIADNLNALVLGIGETLDELRQIHKTFQRIADAVEAIEERIPADLGQEQ